MKPTDILIHEHEIILKVLDAAEREVAFMDETGTLHEETIERMVDFIRNFADRCHHAKEEKKLFVFLEQRGLSAQSGPVAVMLHDHETGREFVRGVAAGLELSRTGDGAAVAMVRNNLAGYINLLRMHIHKENNILFPMAARLMNPEDEARLLAEFEQVEAEDIGEGVHEKYHQMAHDLTR
ncbi:MAG TPA: hemerythrin domain-containing protein [bacterium]|jgi:hemerythrin-like domain-containing protein